MVLVVVLLEEVTEEVEVDLDLDPGLGQDLVVAEEIEM